MIEEDEIPEPNKLRKSAYMKINPTLKSTPETMNRMGDKKSRIEVRIPEEMREDIDTITNTEGSPYKNMSEFVRRAIFNQIKAEAEVISYFKTAMKKDSLEKDPEYYEDFEFVKNITEKGLNTRKRIIEFQRDMGLLSFEK